MTIAFPCWVLQKKADRLPQRVLANITDLQHKSELLVAAVELAIIAFLGFFYYLAPVGHPADAPVLSAPLGLSLFGILTLVRLWFAWTRQMPPLFLGVMVVGEMAILIFTIWTYHLQFETVATINLKNTHLTYVFVLIALRALRFEPLWVILSGLTAAVGWGLVVWHALKTTSLHVITWDYVTYASTRSVHPGAEMDKVLTILLVTAIIAFVLKRARNTLLDAVTQTQAAEDLSRFFDKEVAEKIVGAENQSSVGHAERRLAAIMFIDLRGFTLASKQLGPEALIELLGEYQALAIPVIRSHNGSIDKFLGDGILASFGAVTPSAAYAADALAAAQEIVGAARAWKERRAAAGLAAPAVGVAVAAGEVLFGVIGHADRLEYTVLGDAVNLAAKLEKHTKVENVKALTDLPTYRVSQQQGFKPDLDIRNDRTVAGCDELVSVAVVAA